MAGLLDEIQRAQTAQSRGLLSHAPAQRVTGRQVADAAQAVGLLTAPIPVVGDVMGLLGDAAMYATKPEERTAGNMALTVLGVLPFFPALAGRLGKAGKLLDVTDKNTYKAVREAMGGKVTEAEVRQAIAQYNAALPKAAGGLGMEAGNTAADRARVQGWSGGWFHGSPEPGIREFDPTRSEKRGVDFGAATFVTKNADNASGYALNWDAYKNLPQHAQTEAKRQDILNRFLRARDAGDERGALAIRQELKSLKSGDDLYDDFLNYRVPVDGSTVYPLMIRGDGMPWVDGARQNFNRAHPAAIEAARAQGAPGVRINDVADNSGRFNGLSDVTAVFDPSRLRSRFAAFDPAQQNSRNLLASMAGVGLLSPAVIASFRDEQQQ